MIAVRRILVSLVALLLLWAGYSVAQERPAPSHPRGDSGLGRQLLAFPRRARLGISVDLRPAHDDSGGARIESVTPEGPAAKAGLKSGDIITRLDGKAVGSGMQLTQIVSQFKADQTVSVEYLRDGTRHTTSLVTGDEPFTVFEMPEGQLRFAFPRMEVERFPRGFAFETGPGAFTMEFGGPLMDLQLAPLNPDLGQYFGTPEGVLVINAPKESTLGVKGGDVILTVDGRKTTGPSSLLRILRSYDPGDSFKLEIMRNKSRMTVTGQIEKRRER